MSYSYIKDTSKFPYSERIAVINGTLNSNDIDCLKKEQPIGIACNSAYGWSGTEFSFLRELGFIENLSILSGQKQDMSSLPELPNLKKLALSAGCIGLLEVDKLSQLSDLFYHNASGKLKFKGLNSAYNLRKVEGNIAISEIEQLKGAVNLKYLSTSIKRYEDIDWLYDFDLTQLHIARSSRFSSLAPVNSQKNLKVLWLNDCGSVKNIPVIFEHTEISILGLCGNISNISSLAGIEKMKSLRFFRFIGDLKVEDGDMSVLKKIANVDFTDHKHYNMFSKDFNFNQKEYMQLLHSFE